MTRLPLRLTFISAALATSLPALATNGTMPHGYGIKAQGMGGASIALPQDALAAANNPAGMALVGNRVDLGLAVVMPKPASTFGGTDFDGDGVKAIPIPEFGYNRMLDSRQSVGVSVYGNGVTTKYDTNILGGPGSGKDGAKLMQLIVAPTYAVKLSDTQAVGVSLDLAYQRFRVDGVPDATGQEGQGTETSMGAGFKLGWTGQVSERVTLGAMYAARMRMGKLDAYRNLLANRGAGTARPSAGSAPAGRPPLRCSCAVASATAPRSSPARTPPSTTSPPSRPRTTSPPAPPGRSPTAASCRWFTPACSARK
ncbi:MAG: outer membrane protein transport protein [Zoogloea sp.]|nr:outer membrane protein transport protein [Zoogloea sp.]